MSEMIRKGTIIGLDRVNGIGTIMDENEQEIEFLLDEGSPAVDLGQQVSFRIDLVNLRLLATGVNSALLFSMVALPENA